MQPCLVVVVQKQTAHVFASMQMCCPAAALLLCVCRLLRIEILLTVATFALAIYNLVAGEVCCYCCHSCR